MPTILKITQEQMNEMKKYIAENWQLNPNKYQFVGAYINKFREKLGMPGLQKSDIHAALQSGYFRFQPVNDKGYYRKEDIEYALGPGLKSLKRYFGVQDEPVQDGHPEVQVPSFIPVNRELGRAEEDALDSRSGMEQASDELLRNQEVMYGPETLNETIDSLVRKIPSFYEGTNNRSLPVPLSETNAQRLINRHSDNGYIIISACRGWSDFGLDPDNLADKETLNYKNKIRTKSLQNDIQSFGFSYTPCYGGFVENLGTENEDTVYEKSFIVYARKKDGSVDFDLLKRFGLDMCDKYNQDSVLIKTPGDMPAYYNRNGGIECQFDGDIAFNDITKTYFTDLYKNTQKGIRNGSKPTRFSFTETFIAPKPQCYSEGHIRFMRGEIFLNS